MKSPISKVYAVEGDPYEVTTATGLDYAKDFRVGADLPDGRSFLLSGFIAKGKVLHPDDGVLVMDARPLAEAMAKRVEAVGEITLERWEEVQGSDDAEE